MAENQLNGTMLQGFSWNLPADGQHWRRLAHMAERLVNTGFTSIWLPPAYKGQAGIKDVGYGVYDLWDLGEFDQKETVPTKYGERRDYETCVFALQQAGLDVLADIVLNHKMGADATEKVMARQVAQDNRLQDVTELEPITAWTRFDFPGRAGELDDFTWNWKHFKGTDYNDDTKSNGIWLFEGKGWDPDVAQEAGNFDYLMGNDIDLHNKEVYQQLVKWGVWYLETSGVDGVRLDAVKHMSKSFYQKWLADVRKEVGKELFCVGEYWSYRVENLISYLDGNQTMSLFDVPLHFAFYNASVNRDGIDFAHMLDGSFVSVDPVHAVTFVENHDTQPNQALESTVQPWFKPVAYAIILLREAGYPCVFFSDLFGLPNDQIPAVAELPLLMEVRRRFAFGPQHDYLDERDLAGWTREGDSASDEDGVAVVLCNRPFPEVSDVTPVEQPDPAESDEGAAEDGQDAHDHDDEVADESWTDAPNVPCKEMYVGKVHAGETWRCVLGDVNDVIINADGVGAFPGSETSMVSVYLPESAAANLDAFPIVRER